MWNFQGKNVLIMRKAHNYVEISTINKLVKPFSLNATAVKWKAIQSLSHRLSSLIE